MYNSTTVPQPLREYPQTEVGIQSQESELEAEISRLQRIVQDMEMRIFPDRKDVPVGETKETAPPASRYFALARTIESANTRLEIILGNLL